MSCYFVFVFDMFVRDCLHIRKRLQLVVIVSTETPRIKMAAARQSYPVKNLLRIEVTLKQPPNFKRNFERLIRSSHCRCILQPDEPNKTINFDLIKYHLQIDYFTNPVVTYCNVFIALEIEIDRIIAHKSLNKFHQKNSKAAIH